MPATLSPRWVAAGLAALLLVMFVVLTDGTNGESRRLGSPGLDGQAERAALDPDAASMLPAAESWILEVPTSSDDPGSRIEQQFGAVADAFSADTDQGWTALASIVWPAMTVDELRSCQDPERIADLVSYEWADLVPVDSWTPPGDSLLAPSWEVYRGMATITVEAGPDQVSAQTEAHVAVHDQTGEIRVFPNCNSG